MPQLSEEGRKRYIESLPNWRVNVLDLCTLSEEDIDWFQSEFREVALAFQAGKPVGAALEELLRA